MPASTTPLTTIAEAGTFDGQAWDEQDINATNGNTADNASGNTMMGVRNSTAGAIVLNFYADVGGTEIIIDTVSIPGSGTENGFKMLGPFHPSQGWNEHSVTDSAKNGSIMFRPASGVTGDLKACPFKINRTALS